MLQPGETLRYDTGSLVAFETSVKRGWGREEGSVLGGLGMGDS